MTRVMVVDDRPENLELAAYLLRAGGFDVLVTDNPSGAVAQAGEWLPDLVLLDLHMPDMDGWQVLERLAADGATAGIQVALFTVTGTPLDLVEAEENGWAHWVRKAVEPAEFLADVRRVLNQSSARRRAVLVVDDDPVWLRFVSYLLTTSGHLRGLTAADAGELGEVLERDRPDLILMDIKLPGRSGLDLVGDAGASEGDEGLPIAACTACPEGLPPVSFGPRGFSGVLAKALEPELLAREIEAFLAACQLRPGTK
ncbi:MAG: response regulator [Acidimicrobiia bacterium]